MLFFILDNVWGQFHGYDVLNHYSLFLLVVFMAVFVPQLVLLFRYIEPLHHFITQISPYRIHRILTTKNKSESAMRQNFANHPILPTPREPWQGPTRQGDGIDPGSDQQNILPIP